MGDTPACRQTGKPPMALNFNSTFIMALGRPPPFFSASTNYLPSTQKYISLSSLPRIFSRPFNKFSMTCQEISSEISSDLSFKVEKCIPNFLGSGHGRSSAMTMKINHSPPLPLAGEGWGEGGV